MAKKKEKRTRKSVLDAKKARWIAVAAIAFVICVFLAAYLYMNFIRGALPAVRPPAGDVSRILEDSEVVPRYTLPMPSEVATSVTIDEENGFARQGPFTLPAGYRLEAYAEGLDGVRDLVLGPDGEVWASQPSEGRVVRLARQGDNTAEPETILSGLNRPHGLAFDPRDPILLYIAEEDAIRRFRVTEDTEPSLVAELPEGGRHVTRSLAFGSDGRLYVSIGSTCDTCYEEDDRHGTVQVVDTQTGELSEYATGLRNAVFMATEPIFGELFVTEMGRDFLGDDLPPDEINVIREGRDYGWPACYGQNVPDQEFEDRRPDDACQDKEPAYADLQAHSAPLGIDFVPEEGWPEAWWYDAVVAYHGSWNRTEPTGYKLVRIMRSAQGRYLGTQDFVTGWLLDDNSTLGRPVDVLIRPGGVMYVSDDKSGVVYRFSPDVE